MTKPKKCTYAKHVVINNMQLNTFYTCAFVRFVKEVSVMINVFEISFIKIVQSFHNTFSLVMHTSFRFPNRRMVDSETDIIRHICIITGVRTVCN